MQAMSIRSPKLVSVSMRRPLTPKEQDLLMILLNIMRIMCDSPGILKNNPVANARS